jgi:glycerol-3-phosphate O-acyltransferase
MTARRDLFFVPIAITYEKLVEESAIVSERRGEKKEAESVLGLVKARKFLRSRFGSVCVNFGEPISLADALGSRREKFLDQESEEVAQEKRKFVEALGNRIVERINWAVVPNATSVAACALLGEKRRGCFRGELAARMQEIVDLLRLQDVRLTPALDSDGGEFSEAIDSLLRDGLIRSARDMRGEVLYYEANRRTALDLYRNSIVHYLAAPSFLARRLLHGTTLDELRGDLAHWLDIFYCEFFTPRGEVLAAHFDAFVDHFERFGWLERNDVDLRVTEKGVGYFEFLSEQTRGFVEVYHATASAVLGMDHALTTKDLSQAAREQLHRNELLGEVASHETANDTTFSNAVALLERLAIIERDPTASGKEVPYVRAKAFDDLPALRERLAFALAAR